MLITMFYISYLRFYTTSAIHQNAHEVYIYGKKEDARIRDRGWSMLKQLKKKQSIAMDYMGREHSHPMHSAISETLNGPSANASGRRARRIEKRYRDII